MTASNPWLDRIKAAKLPVLLPQSAMPAAAAPLSDWNQAVREDPLLGLQIFGHANRMIARSEQQVSTLDHAVAVLGARRLLRLNQMVPRISPGSTAYRGLRQNVGDGLLAASLMQQWFKSHQLPWTHADFWLALFYDVGLWSLWLLEPQRMEAFEQRSSEGRERTDLIEQLIGQSLRGWSDDLTTQFKLPTLPETLDFEELDQIEERIPPHKNTALSVMLPLSHHLAYQLRLSWESPQLDRLCRIGTKALGITGFRNQLKHWVPQAARQYRLPEAATAARLLLAQQPSLYKAPPKPAPTGIREPNLDRAEDLRDKPIGTTRKAEPLVETAPPPPPPEPVVERPKVNLKAYKSARQWLRGTTEDSKSIHCQALKGLQQGLGLSRIVVMELADGQWQAVSSAGCAYYLLLRNLRLPLDKSPVIQEFGRRTAALWMNDSNRDKAMQRLPAELLKAADSQAFFLRSFKIGRAVSLLVYADAKGDSEDLNEHDYQRFREFCADWNNALNRIQA